MEYKYHFDEKSDSVLKNPEFPTDKYELVKPGDKIKITDQWSNHPENNNAGEAYFGWTPLYRPIDKGNPMKTGLIPATVVKGKLYRHKDYSGTYYLGCDNKSLIIIKDKIDFHIGNKVVSFKKNRKFWAGLYEN